MIVTLPGNDANAEHMHSTHALCEFELQRLQRMQRNAQVLIDMGLQDAAKQLTAVAGQQSAGPKKKRQLCKACEHDGNTNPSRRSRRLAGHAMHDTDIV